MQMVNQIIDYIVMVQLSYFDFFYDIMVVVSMFKCRKCFHIC